MQTFIHVYVLDSLPTKLPIFANNLSSVISERFAKMSYLTKSPIAAFDELNSVLSLKTVNKQLDV